MEINKKGSEQSHAEAKATGFHAELWEPAKMYYPRFIKWSNPKHRKVKGIKTSSSQKDCTQSQRNSPFPSHARKLERRG